MMTSEIRDLATANLLVQATLTGHLVFSTLHTNDAIDTTTHLLDMGVEPFLSGTTSVLPRTERYRAPPPS